SAQEFQPQIIIHRPVERWIEPADRFVGRSAPETGRLNDEITYPGEPVGVERLNMGAAGEMTAGGVDEGGVAVNNVDFRVGLKKIDHRAYCAGSEGVIRIEPAQNVAA